VKRVLIVDDAASNRKVLAALLAQAGYEVSEAEDSQAARQLVIREGTDCLITDRHMPDEGGVELAMSLRASAEGRGLRLVLMSADGGGALPPGLFDAVLEKPVTLAALQAAIEG